MMHVPGTTNADPQDTGRLQAVRTVHAPGMGVSETRQLSSRLFLEALEERQVALAVRAWKNHLEHGRCALFIDDTHWLELIRQPDNTHEIPSRCLRLGESVPGSDDPFLTSALSQMLCTYEVEQDVIVAAHHRSAGFFSVYWLRTDPVPPAAYELAEMPAEAQHPEALDLRTA